MITIIVCGISGCGGDAGGAKPAAATVPAKSAALLPLQAKLDLGVITQGKSVELACWVTNRGEAPVRISKIETSCECLTVKLSKNQIAPGEKTLAHVLYDGAKDPDYVGSLHIEVQLYEDKTKIGQLHVPIELIREQVPSSEAGD